MPKLTPDEVADALKQKDVLLVDVRDPVQIREKGSIAGHVNVPLKELEGRLGELPKSTRIITA